jgi:hypothetical protein
MKIKGYAHILLINHWYSIIMGQIRIMINSGLYDRCEEINIGCLGKLEERALLEKHVVNVYSKLKFRYYSSDISKYEFPTIQLIEDDNSEYVGFYFHTKAVTKPADTVNNVWREWLNEAILRRWVTHYINVAERRYGASGVNFMHSPDHYSGNFFWFNREYINTLPKISTLDPAWRYNAEQWICMNKNKRIFKGEFKEPGRDVFKMQHK